MKLGISSWLQGVVYTSERVMKKNAQASVNTGQPEGAAARRHFAAGRGRSPGSPGTPLLCLPRPAPPRRPHPLHGRRHPLPRRRHPHRRGPRPAGVVRTPPSGPVLPSSSSFAASPALPRIRRDPRAARPGGGRRHCVRARRAGVAAAPDNPVLRPKPTPPRAAGVAGHDARRRGSRLAAGALLDLLHLGPVVVPAPERDKGRSLTKTRANERLTYGSKRGALDGRCTLSEAILGNSPHSQPPTCRDMPG